MVIVVIGIHYICEICTVHRNIMLVTVIFFLHCMRGILLINFSIGAVFNFLFLLHTTIIWPYQAKTGINIKPTIHLLFFLCYQYNNEFSTIDFWTQIFIHLTYKTQKISILIPVWVTDTYRVQNTHHYFIWKGQFFPWLSNCH